MFGGITVYGDGEFGHGTGVAAPDLFAEHFFNRFRVK